MTDSVERRQADGDEGLQPCFKLTNNTFIKV